MYFEPVSADEKANLSSRVFKATLPTRSQLMHGNIMKFDLSAYHTALHTWASEHPDDFKKIASDLAKGFETGGAFAENETLKQYFAGYADGTSELRAAAGLSNS